MLTFFVFLGQVPGTHFYLTFNELMVAYLVAMISYTVHREHRLAKQAIKHLVVNFWVWVSQPKRGRPAKQVALWPDHTNLAPLVNIDFGYLSQRLHLVRRAA